MQWHLKFDVIWEHVRLPPWLSGKESICDAGTAGDAGSIPWSGRSPGKGNGNPLQYSCLESSMDGGAWLATVHGVAESDMTERLHYLPTISWKYFKSKIYLIHLTYCQGTFNFKESNMLHFSSFVCHFSRILCSLSVPILGMSRAARSSQYGDHGKGYLLGFLSVTPFSDSFQHQRPCMY